MPKLRWPHWVGLAVVGFIILGLLVGSPKRRNGNGTTGHATSLKVSSHKPATVSRHKTAQPYRPGSLGVLQGDGADSSDEVIVPRGVLKRIHTGETQAQVERTVGKAGTELVDYNNDASREYEAGFYVIAGTVKGGNYDEWYVAYDYCKPSANPDAPMCVIGSGPGSDPNF